MFIWEEYDEDYPTGPDLDFTRQVVTEPDGRRFHVFTVPPDCEEEVWSQCRALAKRKADEATEILRLMRKREEAADRKRKAEEQLRVLNEECAARRLEDRQASRKRKAQEQLRVLHEECAGRILKGREDATRLRRKRKAIVAKKNAKIFLSLMKHKADEDTAAAKAREKINVIKLASELYEEAMKQIAALRERHAEEEARTAMIERVRPLRVVSYLGRTGIFSLQHPDRRVSVAELLSLAADTNHLPREWKNIDFKDLKEKLDEHNDDYVAARKTSAVSGDNVRFMGVKGFRKNADGRFDLCYASMSDDGMNVQLKVKEGLHEYHARYVLSEWAVMDPRLINLRQQEQFVAIGKYDTNYGNYEFLIHCANWKKIKYVPNEVPAKQKFILLDSDGAEYTVAKDYVMKYRGHFGESVINRAGQQPQVYQLIPVGSAPARSTSSSSPRRLEPLFLKYHVNQALERTCLPDSICSGIDFKGYTEVAAELHGKLMDLVRSKQSSTYVSDVNRAVIEAVKPLKWEYRKIKNSNSFNPLESDRELPIILELVEDNHCVAIVGDYVFAPQDKEAHELTNDYLKTLYGKDGRNFKKAWRFCKSM